MSAENEPGGAQEAGDRTEPGQQSRLERRLERRYQRLLAAYPVMKGS
jgi:hypothetical protein